MYKILTNVYVKFFFACCLTVLNVIIYQMLGNNNIISWSVCFLFNIPFIATYGYVLYWLKKPLTDQEK